MATAPAPLPTPAGAEATRARVQLVDGAVGDAVALQRAAEHTMLRGAVVGTIVGIVLGGLVWAGLVAVALISVGGFALSGPVWMGAAVGVFAGSFLGSWAGVVATTPALERVEHALRMQPR
ncbi:MAG: hypothetical protein ACT452_09055 [Microthrixaceae bacterium]